MATFAAPWLAERPAASAAAGVATSRPWAQGHSCGAAGAGLAGVAAVAALAEVRRLRAPAGTSAARSVLRGAAARPRVVRQAEGPSTEAQNELADALREAVDAESRGDSIEEVVVKEQVAANIAVNFTKGFSGFGSAEMAEKKDWTTVDLAEEGIESLKELLEIEDSVAGARRLVLSVIFFGGLLLVFLLNPPAIYYNLIGGSIIAGSFIDNLVNNGAFQALVFESIANGSNSDYNNRVVQHESARFLVGYLMGVLPKAYTLNTSDALDRYESTRLKYGCAFCAAKFQTEITSGKVKAQTIDQYLCVKLAGIVQEYLMFGKAQSGGANLGSVEDLFRALEFPAPKQQAITRWALYNTVTLLKRNKGIQAELAAAMSRGASPVECIMLIEKKLAVGAAA